MSWLDERKINYQYKCEKCEQGIVCKQFAKDERIETIRCDCGGTANYVGFLPDKVRITTRTAFEKNGRKAYCIDSGNGKPVYISKSKMDYLEKGVVGNNFTKEAIEASKATVAPLSNDPEE